MNRPPNENRPSELIVNRVAQRGPSHGHRTSAAVSSAARTGTKGPTSSLTGTANASSTTSRRSTIKTSIDHTPRKGDQRPDYVKRPHLGSAHGQRKRPSPNGKGPLNCYFVGSAVFV